MLWAFCLLVSQAKLLYGHTGILKPRCTLKMHIQHSSQGEPWMPVVSVILKEGVIFICTFGKGKFNYCALPPQLFLSAGKAIAEIYFLIHSMVI